MAEKVRVKYEGKEYEFVRAEEVYEIVNGKRKKVAANGNALLRLAGHTLKSRQDYKANPSSFDTGGYWSDFVVKNSYAPSHGSVPPAKTKSGHRAEEPKKAPELSDNIKAYIEEQVRLRTKVLEDKNEKLKKKVNELKNLLKDKDGAATTQTRAEKETKPLPNGDDIAYGTTIEEYEAQQAAEAEETATGPNFPSKKDSRSWKDRAKDWFYRPVVRTSTVWATRNIEGNDVREQWTVESDEREVRPAAMIIVGLGITAVAGYIGYKLGQNLNDGVDIDIDQFGNNFDDKSINELEDLFDRDLDGDGDIGIFDFDGNEGLRENNPPTRSERHYWNEGAGDDSVAIELPNGYDFEIDANGHHDIVEESTGDVVGDDIQMTETGAVSQDSLDELEGLEKVDQEHLRYFDNTGPTENPRLPSAENPGYNTHTVTVLGRE